MLWCMVGWVIYVLSAPTTRHLPYSRSLILENILLVLIVRVEICMLSISPFDSPPLYMNMNMVI